ncbi:hypothetical protein NP493_755g01043 [Ridgeia piscesae]|uniref:Glutamyl-tRNA(Gln) amidotransferase subunit C, mitochondrial n=1 Tax=Ridgeia piscesae TaxID=27915 RepID=A0AAD9KPB5_RIDPI|nr:hypothetical protein NP493_755g01043 [Ridgeia piscesae]
MRQTFNFAKRVVVCRCCRRLYSTKIRSKLPTEQSWVPQHLSDKLPMKTVINDELVNQLERVALVDFATQEGVTRLDRAIRFADQLHQVDTTGVEPMDSVLDDRSLYLRPDNVTEGNNRAELMKCAQKTIEEYYVAPPGNIPLERTDRNYGRQSDDENEEERL